MRLLQRIPLRGKANIAGSLEVFNLFNRKNYGSYNLTETSPHVRTAELEHEPVIRAADGAARVPTDLLVRSFELRRSKWRPGPFGPGFSL